MLQTLRERRCDEEAHENAWKTRDKIWVDAEVASEACQIRNQAEAQMAIELKPILKTRQLKLRKPTIREPTVVSNPVRPRPPRPVDTWYQPFCSTRAVDRTDLDKKSP